LEDFIRVAEIAVAVVAIAGIVGWCIVGAIRVGRG